jgi:hypothetical protein
MLSKPVTNCDRFKFEMPIWHLKTIGFFSGEWVRFLTPKALANYSPGFELARTLG